MASSPYLVYFAGDLFDQKHLTGNALLAEMIEKVSNGKYKLHLPQNKETIEGRGVIVKNDAIENVIRDRDLENLLKCDVAVYNFDGTDLDSGTVVEFCYGKMVDIPCVQLRTDIRLNGDQDKGGDPWNLMVSGFPRTKSLCLCSLLMWHEIIEKYHTLPEQLNAFHKAIAEKIVETLDYVISQESIFKKNKEQAKLAYSLAIKSAGGQLYKVLPEETVNKLVDIKFEKGLI